MRIIGRIARGVAHVLVVVAKAIGGMGGRKTFDQDNDRALAQERDDYRP